MIVDYDELAHNNNQELTDVIIANAGKMNPRYLVRNTNPSLAPLILKLIEDAKVNDDYIYATCNPNVRIIELLNSGKYYAIPNNPGITDHIIKMVEENESVIFRIAKNPDPKLTKIIKDFSIKIINLFKGQEFSDHVKLFSEFLSKNTNPELAEVIMIAPYWAAVSSNSNTGVYNCQRG